MSPITLHTRLSMLAPRPATAATAGMAAPSAASRAPGSGLLRFFMAMYSRSTSARSARLWLDTDSRWSHVSPRPRGSVPRLYTPPAS